MTCLLCTLSESSPVEVLYTRKEGGAGLTAPFHTHVPFLFPPAPGFSPRAAHSIATSAATLSLAVTKLQAVNEGIESKQRALELVEATHRQLAAKGRGGRRIKK
jgi:HPt (histidine-containing phosphotransfer) domain-containing protein